MKNKIFLVGLFLVLAAGYAFAQPSPSCEWCVCGEDGANDPYCCEEEWDEVCVEEAYNECANECGFTTTTTTVPSSTSTTTPPTSTTIPQAPEFGVIGIGSLSSLFALMLIAPVFAYLIVRRRK